MRDGYLTRDITTPKHGMVVYKDAYWVCEAGDPSKALFYGNSPQCNRNQKIPEMLMKEIYPPRFKDLAVVFVETAFVPRRD